MRDLRERDIDVNGYFVVISPKEKKPKLVPMLQEDIDLYRSLPTSFPDLPFFPASDPGRPVAGGEQVLFRDVQKELEPGLQAFGD